MTLEIELNFKDSSNRGNEIIVTMHDGDWSLEKIKWYSDVSETKNNIATRMKTDFLAWPMNWSKIYQQ